MNSGKNRQDIHTTNKIEVTSSFGRMCWKEVWSYIGDVFCCIWKWLKFMMLNGGRSRGGDMLILQWKESREDWSGT